MIKSSESFIETQLEIIKQIEPVLPENHYKDIVKYFLLGVNIGRAAQIIDETVLVQINKEVKNV